MLKGRLGLETARIPHADRHGLLWLSRGRLQVEDGTLHFVTTGWPGGLAPGDYGIPFQMVSCVLLGPGGSVTHDALRLLARNGTGLVCVGEDGTRHYASMPFGPDNSKIARAQVRAWSDPEQRIAIARRMYAWRLGEILPASDIAVLRGIEGARMKELYAGLARRIGINWRGRRYDRSNPAAADLPNQALNHAATAVQAAAAVAVATVGAIPQIGFIHEESGSSFCLDMADLCRGTVTVPAAFQAAREVEAGRGGEIERVTRRTTAKMLRDQKVIPDLIDRIKALFLVYTDPDGGADGGGSHS